MSEKALDQEVLQYFHNLSKPQQLGVLNYLKSLVGKQKMKNEGLLKLAGSIPAEDLKQMEQAIEESCEQIDKDEW